MWNATSAYRLLVKLNLFTPRQTCDFPVWGNWSPPSGKGLLQCSSANVLLARGGDGVIDAAAQEQKPWAHWRKENLHHDTLDLMKFAASKWSHSNLRLESCNQSFIQAGMFIFFCVYRIDLSCFCFPMPQECLWPISHPFCLPDGDEFVCYKSSSHSVYLLGTWTSVLTVSG